ncbi:NAD-glutamate dehydrogenase [Nocardioidaceae bacterium]|nr:NAD-glutamate dehydrogenase [Nocardioidaceae bacterium]
MRVLTPTESSEGWSASGHSVLEVVTDDMPFLVDSVTMAVSNLGTEIHTVLHPQVLVRRDEHGGLLEVLGEDSDRSGDTGAEGVLREAWMHVEVDRESDAADLRALEESVTKSLADNRAAVEDWRAMQDRVGEIVEQLEARREDGVVDHLDDDLDESIALLQWLADDHFTFLGFRCYDLVELEAEDLPDDAEDQGSTRALCPQLETGLGILRAAEGQEPTPSRLPAEVADQAVEPTVLVLAKANSKATVHRPAHLDYVGVKRVDEDGRVVGEWRFLGLYSSTVYTETITRIPVVRRKVEQIFEIADVDRVSHTGKALMDVLENYPREELLTTPVDELAPTATAVMRNRERRQVRLFIRSDRYARYLSCLVYLPRDRYTTAVREKVTAILKEQLRGESVEYTARVNESFLARLHIVVRPPRDEGLPTYDHEDLERRLKEVARSWRDDFLTALDDEFGEERGAELAKKYAPAVPDSYEDHYVARTAAVDVGRLEALEGEEDLSLRLFERVDSRPGEIRLKLYRRGTPLTLSNVLPVLTDLGAEVVDEHPFPFEGLGVPTHVYDFGLRTPEPVPSGERDRIAEALLAVWEGRAESDSYNTLVLAAGLDWREVVVLRAYGKYLQQAGTPFSQDYVAETLASAPRITSGLVGLFEARFDPDFDGDREAAQSDIRAEIESDLEAVASLDHDRIFRSFLTMLEATLRTNHYQAAGPRDGGTGSAEHHDYLSLKLDPGAIPDLPQPRPAYEIFVCSPQVEGVHLRFGATARGGLRWSDRRDDFRTEVLGLVKAQMVKNAVIVPTGAKGGFFAKQLPDPAEDREAFQAEGRAAYATFISGLLDLTDNLVDGEVVPPARVVRHDDDDTYMVVAADKGTATFSDLANSISADYDFWLGDAFASGGSEGYDHKAMGITAKGAWVSVQRHFREMDVDVQREEFTVIGVGDMSGDVFGNGMLLSEHIRLVAAFDHRDIFVDPDPDTAASYEERKRLFEADRSSWADYDESVISEGGGVHSRQAKRIELTPQVRTALGIDDDVAEMTPAELIHAILLAPVDLLWNGGIGTYVKASTESHADVGDKANDQIRVDGADLRVKVVGEGGNLGLTQLGRVEFARAGGRVNTDFIDNSGGVDTSDREVNIKILLDRVVKDGDLTRKQRNRLLESMTDEVAMLVLADNYEQNTALANAVLASPSLLHVQEDWIRTLEADDLLDRELEFLPSRKEMRTRQANGEGLTTPELCVLLAYTKIAVLDALLDSELPDEEFFSHQLEEYFPTAMREKFADRFDDHPLRRMLVATMVTNNFVNHAGITYYHRLRTETGSAGVDIVRAHLVARQVFGTPELVQRVSHLDNEVPAEIQNELRGEVRQLLEISSRWLLTNRRTPLDGSEVADRFTTPVRELLEQLTDLFGETEQAAYEEKLARYDEGGVPEDLARAVALLEPSSALLGIVETALRDDADQVDAARVHFTLSECLGLTRVIEKAEQLPTDDRWETMARSALFDDLDDVAAELTAQVLAATEPGEEPAKRVQSWSEETGDGVERTVELLTAVSDDDEVDLARMSVAVRALRSLLS